MDLNAVQWRARNSSHPFEDWRAVAKNQFLNALHCYPGVLDLRVPPVVLTICAPDPKWIPAGLFASASLGEEGYA